MKKIVHIITKLELGGAQLNAVYSVNYFAELGFDATLVFGSGGILDKSLINPKVKQFEIPELIRNINPFRDAAALIKLFIFLKKNKFDIIHTHSSKAGILGRFAAKLAGSKKIFHTVHGWGFTPNQNFLKRRLFIFLEKIAARFTDKIIVVAKDNILKGLDNNIGCENKYVLIRSGIDFKKFEMAYNLDIQKKNKIKSGLGIKPGNITIIMTACFKPQKNPLEFVKIASILNNRFSNLNFILIGGGELKNVIEQEIKRFGLDNKITLTGWRKDVENFLISADIFCLTSLWEGLPRSILEAFACRLPVIASRVDGTPEVVIHNETGFLYECGDIESAVKYFEILIKDKTKRAEFGKAGFNLVNQEFSIEKMLNDLKLLIDQ
ncbi:MAG TPA: glycosyltransferase family 4 protein [bacterium]|nr:glycosyltransferase family 4 protein [bacterium]